MPIKNAEIHLISRPVGLPTADNFALVETELPDPRQGEIVVRNHFMSVDPYMRGRMVDRKSYVPPFALNEVMTGGAVGEVVASRGGKYAVGDHVLSMMGWREHFVSDGRSLNPVDVNLMPMQSYLGTAGMPGMTAYFGLLDLGQPQAGETVFVSAAAGAVGSVVCQIARIKGCRVVGSAGSGAKVDWLTEIAGVDGAFNYKETSPHDALAQFAPNGVDVYFDNVGGDHLEAAIHHMNNHGRGVICGMISLYNATEASAAPRNLPSVIGKRLKLQGFIVTDFIDQSDRFYADMAGWIGNGQIRTEETVVQGLAVAPEAFIGLFAGENLGKMLVELT